MVGATDFTYPKIGINNKQLGIKRYHPLLRVKLTHGKRRGAENSIERQPTTKRGSTERFRMK
jgi:hypothetical protein